MSQSAGDEAGARLASLAGVKVIGVRMAEQIEQSGAIIGFPDGRQRPFLVGHEVVEGVVLSRVDIDGIELAFEGGTQVIAVEASSGSGSLALALMGQSATPGPEAITVDAAVYGAGDKTAALDASPQTKSSSNATWLISTLSQVEMRNGQPYAWRVAAAPPQPVTDAGLRVGDLILAVNGTPPGDPAAVLAAATSGRVAIAVERPSGERALLTLSSGMPS